MPKAETEVEVEPDVRSADELSSWSFIDRLPETDEMLALLKSLPPVHDIEAADYAEFVLPLTQDQNFGSKQEKDYHAVTKLYMTVAGRVKMLNDAAERHAWKVEEDWDVVEDESPRVLRMKISIRGRGDAAENVSPTAGPGVIYGTRLGVSRLKGGDNAWEKAETAARGRAIAAFGFGVLPGSGIASLEETQDALSGPRPQNGEQKQKRPRQELIADVHTKIETLRQLRGQDAEELDQRLQEYIKDRLGVAVTIEAGKGLDLSKLKDGNLLLLEGQVDSKIRQERQDQSEI